MNQPDPKITRKYEVWCVVKASERDGMMTRDVKDRLGLNDHQASSVLQHLFLQGHIRRSRVTDSGGKRFRYWAIGNGPQPFHGGANSLPNVEHKGTAKKRMRDVRQAKVAHVPTEVADVRELLNSHPLNAFLGIRV